jgi:hypothetical protein
MSDVPFGFSNNNTSTSDALDPSSDDLSERLRIKFPDLTNAPPKHYGPTLKHHQLSTEAVKHFVDGAKETHGFDVEEDVKRATKRVRVVPWASARSCVDAIDGEGWVEPWAEDETWVRSFQAN